MDKLLENFQASKGMSIYDVIKEQEQKGIESLGSDYIAIKKLITQYLETNGIFDNNLEEI